jgi:ferric-dicitrate binding protein FerR (iron transport regulator)
MAPADGSKLIHDSMRRESLAWLVEVAQHNRIYRRRARYDKKLGKPDAPDLRAPPDKPYLPNGRARSAGVCA